MSTEAVLVAAKPVAGISVRRAKEDPAWVRWGLTIFAIAVVAILVVIPVVNIFAEALSDGLGAYWRNLFSDPDTRHSSMLTLIVGPIALVANLIFGVAAAWAIARFDFRGRTLLTALIDLPFSVSPVVAGLMFVLIFGLQGYFGQFLRRDGYSIMPYVISLVAVCVFILLFFLLRPVSAQARRGLWNHPLLVVLVGSVVVFAVAFFLQEHFEVWPRHKSLKLIFAIPGLVLATAFITFPFVARELIPVMEAVGVDEELAAISLGASGWQMFWHVTVPNISCDKCTIQIVQFMAEHGFNRDGGYFYHHCADLQITADPKLPAAGYLETETFDPDGWRPFLPNPAFDARTERDVRWGARIVAGFSDDLIRAAVERGRYSDPRVTEYLSQALMERRDKLVQRWLPDGAAQR